MSDHYIVNKQGIRLITSKYIVHLHVNVLYFINSLQDRQHFLFLQIFLQVKSSKSKVISGAKNFKL